MPISFTFILYKVMKHIIVANRFFIVEYGNMLTNISPVGLVHSDLVHRQTRVKVNN